MSSVLPSAKSLAAISSLDAAEKKFSRRKKFFFRCDRFSFLDFSLLVKQLKNQQR